MTLRVANPPDKAIAWCVQLYQSYPESCLRHVRQSYPGSRIVLLVDGDPAGMPRYRELAVAYQAELIEGEHLMQFATTHAYVERLLRQLLAGPEQYFFRIDPDTRVWRRFSWLPGFPCAFGTLETVTEAFRDRIRHPPNIQGGCIGMSREVASEILAQGLLTEAHCVTGALSGWARTRDCAHIISLGRMLDDFVLSWAADAAGFPLVQHPEIASYWRNAVSNEAVTYAVTHPHKEMDTP